MEGKQMKAREILEILDDMAGIEIYAGITSPGPARDKWTERLREAVYNDVSEVLKFSTGADRRPKSLAEYVMRCYSVEAVELVLKLVNTGYEHLIMESIERFISEEI
jgi:hypothetical protein